MNRIMKRTTLLLLTVLATISSCQVSNNFDYSPNKYHTLVNKSTGAKLGISFDYNNHASAYRESIPSGHAPNGIKISAEKVFYFKFMPAVVDGKNKKNAANEYCYIVSENLFALEDGSEKGEGQWLIFRYLDKTNPYQQWKLVEKYGAFTIINKVTGRCVDLAGGDPKEGASVFSYDTNDDSQNNANQKWIIEAQQ